ncbi:MBL fold metallo-hydrolase [Hahella sp. SMD15-11]|uniref:MBL fold metallo-hydrolase n=1 Tax=Thermohahella caldifontis TaxID=3142973 RepID=A0AB39UZI1_9GAMM
MKFTIIPVTPFEQNCTLIWDEATGKAAIVDPGGDLPRIEAAVSKAGVIPEKVLITHGHIDHAGAAADVAERYGIPIEGPEWEDLFWIQGLAQQGAMFGFGAVRSFMPDRWLKDGETVTVGTETLQVIHCPGHTPGHVVFHSVPHRLALVGDVLFNGSIGRTDFPRGDHATLIRSIKTRLFPLGDDVQFIPGHGPMSTFGHERRYNPFVRD